MSFIAKISNYVGDGKYSKKQDYDSDVAKDIGNIITLLNGRVRFGSGTSGATGENIGGVWVQVLTSGTANAQVAVHHELGSQPMGYLVAWQDKAGSLYANPVDASINTIWTSGTAYFKSDTQAGNYMVFLLERGGQ